MPKSLTPIKGQRVVVVGGGLSAAAAARDIGMMALMRELCASAKAQA